MRKFHTLEKDKYYISKDIMFTIVISIYYILKMELSIQLYARYNIKVGRR